MGTHHGHLGEEATLDEGRDGQELMVPRVREGGDREGAGKDIAQMEIRQNGQGKCPTYVEGGDACPCAPETQARRPGAEELRGCTSTVDTVGGEPGLSRYVKILG